MWMCESYEMIWMRESWVVNAWILRNEMRKQKIWKKRENTNVTRPSTNAPLHISTDVNIQIQHPKDILEPIMMVFFLEVNPQTFWLKIKHLSSFIEDIYKLCTYAPSPPSYLIDSGTNLYTHAQSSPSLGPQTA
jgi:hypothetical protein